MAKDKEDKKHDKPEKKPAPAAQQRT